MEPILEFIHVCFSYHSLDGETSALYDISLAVNPGEFVAIVGPSGCGKTTLLSLISGLLKPESGEIRLFGKAQGTSGANIGYMLQRDHLFEWRTVYDNVLLGLEIKHNLTSNTRAGVDSMLDTYGLSAFKDAPPSSLSGGMRQRAALIRTLALEPDILLLDEPFSALDYQTRLEVGDDIGSIIRKEHKTAVLVTHDLSEAITLADKVVILSDRPARIKKILPLHFDEIYDSPLKRRSSPQFSGYFEEIWKELKSNG
ncbi:ABC transporter ATP-binding protein [Lacrimispora sp. NSJ-141]|uniref:ABC transporter ATP-binding protein n=1 Tax=Lientehia hominis TaxID=2897778 RepID=A0AAP2RL17_9FIRM|nr:ABC transporter ATP-binding protein [Lientehia hominis]MCD2493594.1 ABC transporter ATP-binding protein [Lientehia hominis]